jgi:hypothetical protein
MGYKTEIAIPDTSHAIDQTEKKEHRNSIVIIIVQVQSQGSNAAQS